MKVMLNTTLPDNRKTWRLAQLLNVPEYSAIGLLAVLWCKVMRQAPSGDLTGWTSKEIARAATWDGDCEVLVAALKESGFLDGQTNTYQIHDWIDEQGDIVKKRNQWRENQKKFRESKLSETPTAPNTVEATIYAAWKKGSGYPISVDKGAQFIRLAIDRGADAQKIEAAFWDAETCKGKKIWEVLDPLCPERRNGDRRDYSEMMKSLKAWAEEEDAK